MVKKLVVGICGASGVSLAIELLKQVRLVGSIETHLVYTQSSVLTLKQETSLSVSELEALADKVYDNEDYGAALASGSFLTMGMVIIPCSMKTLAGIVSGYCESLLLRAADVTIKEQRKLVIVPRECPFSTIHLRNLYELSKLGGVVIPPVPAYYNHPETIEDINKYIAGKVFNQFNIENKLIKPWAGL